MKVRPDDDPSIFGVSDSKAASPILSYVVEKLGPYPSLQYSLHKDILNVPVQPGAEFSVQIEIKAAEILVTFYRWHHHFDLEDSNAALKCFFLGLTNACRLVVYSRGANEYAWELQVRNGDTWDREGFIMNYRFAFWKRKRLRYMINNLLSCDEAGLFMSRP